MMFAPFIVFMAFCFFMGVAMGTFCAHSERKQAVDELANIQDELNDARKDRDYWFNEFQRLANGIQLHRRLDDGDWWKWDNR